MTLKRFALKLTGYGLAALIVWLGDWGYRHAATPIEAICGCVIMASGLAVVFLISAP